jgi:hypothetical protein
VPDPCYIKLRAGRPATDNRVCQDCYRKHLAAAQTVAQAATTAPTTPASKHIKLESNNGLDGVHWSPSGTERTSKVTFSLPGGVQVVPLSFHLARLEEQKAALHEECDLLLARAADCVEEQMVADDVQAVFARRDLTNVERLKVFDRTTRKSQAQSVHDCYRT